MWRNGGIAVIAWLGMACFGGEPSGPSNPEIYGTWRATKVEYAAQSGGARVDLIALGGTVTLVLNQDMQGTYSYTPSGGPVEVRSFTWSRDGENITWEYMPGNDDNFKVALMGGILRFTLNGSKTWDCDGDGTGEPASWTLEFVR